MKRPLLLLLIIIALPLCVGVAIGYTLRGAADEIGLSSDAVEERERSSSFVRTDTVEALRLSRQTAITHAVKMISPAVVGINVIEIREQRVDPFFRRFFDDQFFDQFFRRRFEVRGLGSGFIVSKDGFIVTNHHVAGNAAKITVTLTGGRKFDAQLVGSDPITDIAVLKIEGDNLPVATFGNSDDIIIGEWAIALGNPFGLFDINDKPTITVGVISSTGMNLGQVGEYVYRDMVETDAAINSGNSGGPLCNTAGEVIGVNTLIFTGGQTSTYVGYGFAIPINKVKRIVEEIKRTGSVNRDYALGFAVQKVDARIARYLRLREVRGVIIAEMQQGSVAEKAGLRVGDIIFSINGSSVNSEEEFLSELGDVPQNTQAEFTIFRNGDTTNVKVRVQRK